MSFKYSLYAFISSLERIGFSGTIFFKKLNDIFHILLEIYSIVNHKIYVFNCMTIQYIAMFTSIFVLYLKSFADMFVELEKLF